MPPKKAPHITAPPQLPAPQQIAELAPAAHRIPVETLANIYRTAMSIKNMQLREANGEQLKTGVVAIVTDEGKLTTFRFNIEDKERITSDVGLSIKFGLSGSMVAIKEATTPQFARELYKKKFKDIGSAVDRAQYCAMLDGMQVANVKYDIGVPIVQEYITGNTKFGIKKDTTDKTIPAVYELLTVLHGKPAELRQYKLDSLKAATTNYSKNAKSINDLFCIYIKNAYCGVSDDTIQIETISIKSAVRLVLSIIPGIEHTEYAKYVGCDVTLPGSSHLVALYSVVAELETISKYYATLKELESII